MASIAGTPGTPLGSVIQTSTWPDGTPGSLDELQSRTPCRWSTSRPGSPNDKATAVLLPGLRRGDPRKGTQIRTYGHCKASPGCPGLQRVLLRGVLGRSHQSKGRGSESVRARLEGEAGRPGEVPDLRKVAAMKPLVTLCRACGEIPLEHNGRQARPRVTCSPECGRAWATARARASRAKLKALHHLRLAAAALSGLQPNRPADALDLMLCQLRAIKPGDLAVPPRQPELSFRQDHSRPGPLR